jgi:hypothetical protein
MYTASAAIQYGASASAATVPYDSIPRGIETPLSFNNLLLNETTFIDKYRLISIEGLDDADVRDSREENPSDDGETAYDTFAGGRTIILNGRIEAFTLAKLRQMQMLLRTAFSSKVELPLYFVTDDPDLIHYIKCKKFSKNQWGEEQKTLNTFFRDFQITLRASNPRFVLDQEETITILPSNPGSVYPTTTNIPLYGNFTSKPLIRIYGSTSDVRFTIQNTAQGISQTFSLQDAETNHGPTGPEFITVPNGAYVEISTENNTFRGFGEFDENADKKDNLMHLLSYDSEWPKLYPILPNVPITGPAINQLIIESGDCLTYEDNVSGPTDSKIEIVYRHSWI